MRAWDGSIVRQLTDSEANDVNADWSPDGTRLIFQHTEVAPPLFPTDLYLINANGKKLQQLTDSPEVDFTPAWTWR